MRTMSSLSRLIGRVGAACIAVMALGLAGCGADDSPEAASAKPSFGSVDCKRGERRGTVDGVPRPRVDRFDGVAACRLVRQQVHLGPRPAGSDASRALRARLRRLLPNGRDQMVDDYPVQLRNVVGRVGKRYQRNVIVGAHYDTKDIPGFVGANDGAAGTAVVVEVAQAVAKMKLRIPVNFMLFDGEEAPAGTPDSEFERYGLRGSREWAPTYADSPAMILLDFVGEPGLRIPREGNSDPRLWRKLRAAARAVGVERVFPDETGGRIIDDHTPFIEAGVPSIDLIDFDYDCWHERCDNLSQISPRSLDAVGETVIQLLRTL